MTRSSHRRVPLAAALALVLFVSGCGSSDTSPEGVAADIATGAADPSEILGEVLGDEAMPDLDEAFDAIGGLGLDTIAQIMVDTIGEVTSYDVSGDRVTFQSPATGAEEFTALMTVCMSAGLMMEAASEVVVVFPSGPQSCDDE